MESKYPTLTELFAPYIEGKLQEGNYACRHSIGEDKPSIWICWTEIVAGVELNDKLDKQLIKMLWGMN